MLLNLGKANNRIRIKLHISISKSPSFCEELPTFDVIDVQHELSKHEGAVDQIEDDDH